MHHCKPLAVAGCVVFLATPCASADTHPQLAQALTVAPEELTMAALTYAIVQGKAPDIKLLKHHRRIFIDENASMPVRRPVRRLAVANRVTVTSAAKLQERANRTGQTFYYLTVTLDSIDGKTAHVSLNTSGA